MSRNAELAAITGANGQLGRLLLLHRDRQGERCRVIVRSRRAAQTVESLPLSSPPDVRIVDYQDRPGLRSALEGCTAIVHLVGIIKESRQARYIDAHEGCCEALAGAAEDAGIRHCVYLSILGSSPDAANACLASKGRAEGILMQGAVPTTVLRVPMVIGPDDHASRALRGQARARIVALVNGGATWQQPLDAADAIRAIEAALAQAPEESRAVDLAGPESLTHRTLVERASALYHRRPVFLSLPLFGARVFAAVLERLAADPPITRAMLEVLQLDDRCDPAEAYSLLGIVPTPLDESLRRYVGPEADAS